jgi:demethylmenaquinone methyltransferase/2-methoxy-6-polyprenyl-1,4-benzoquinol methylase
MSLHKLLEEQIAYYRARAGEYDQLYLRTGRYDRGPEGNRQWFAELAQVAGALAAFAPAGRVLELACGTGWWTTQLARYAGSVTAMDSSPEALAINRARLGTSRVEHVQADLFSWRPTTRFDVVFFGFWLSHVPPERFESFWDLVRACLAPGGRVFFVDSLYNEASTAVDHRLEGPEATTVKRRLNDGREFRIVKVFYRPDELAARLAGMGWQVEVHATPRYFLHGRGAIARSGTG